MALNDKKFCLSHSKSQEAYIIWSWFLMCICKILTSPGPFFCFFKILIFWIILGVYKGKKMAQNEKTFCLSQMESQKLYIICSWFLVHVWNDDISRYCFHFSKFLIFRIIRANAGGGHKGKKWSKMTKNYV